MTAPFHHLPVMADEIVELFRPVPPGVLLDATVGGGGHARRLLEARPDLRLLGLDRDPSGAGGRRRRASPPSATGSRSATPASTTSDSIMSDLHRRAVSGALFDLGSPRPSSTRPSGASPTATTARSTCAWTPTSRGRPPTSSTATREAELARVLQQYGDERFARRIARAIVAARPIETTAELAGIVRDAIPAPARRRGGHPAKRTFQAIRIEVNRELESCPAPSTRPSSRPRPGGRVAVLSYHSGEDRIVKDRFRQAATGGCTCPPGLPCVCDAVARPCACCAPARGSPRRGRGRGQPPGRVGPPASRREAGVGQ